MATVVVPSQPRVTVANRPRLNKPKPGGLILRFLSCLIRNKCKTGLFVFVLCYAWIILRSVHRHTLIRLAEEQQQHSAHEGTASSDKQILKTSTEAKETRISITNPILPTCSFRRYPSRRYYGLTNEDQPYFLSQTEYIFGEKPILLEEIRSVQKLCVNQTEWLDEVDRGKLPFADGTNPSILHIRRLKETEYYQQFLQLGVSFVATICMTNSQCQWKDTQQELKEYNLSLREKPNTVRTVFLFLNQNFQVIKETTILFERNAPWGNRKVRGNEAEIRPLDDARLFVYQKKIWVSFRDGPAFGYDKQVLNPLHILSMDRIVFKASETLSFCCGRNMALMTHSDPTLQALTWVDPVTVIDVNTVQSNKLSRRRLTAARDAKPKKSHIHGTNAFMVPFQHENESKNESLLLGMAHFHRPFDRNTNDYARFGHHYTHAFFVISAHPPYRLVRLSPEFVLPSYHHVDDAEVIQFVSGLEVFRNQVVLAWGINDCEGAAGIIALDVVYELLRDVSEGKEVVDLMMMPTS